MNFNLKFQAGKPPVSLPVTVRNTLARAFLHTVTFVFQLNTQHTLRLTGRASIRVRGKSSPCRMLLRQGWVGEQESAW